MDQSRVNPYLRLVIPKKFRSLTDESKLILGGLIHFPKFVDYDFQPVIKAQMDFQQGQKRMDIELNLQSWLQWKEITLMYQSRTSLDRNYANLKNASFLWCRGDSNFIAEFIGLENPSTNLYLGASIRINPKLEAHIFDRIEFKKVAKGKGDEIEAGVLPITVPGININIANDEPKIPSFGLSYRLSSVANFKFKLAHLSSFYGVMNLSLPKFDKFPDSRLDVCGTYEIENKHLGFGMRWTADWS